MHILKGPFEQAIIDKLANEIKEHGITIIFYKHPQEIIQHLNNRTDLKGELVFEEYGIEDLETEELKRSADEYCIYIKGKKPNLHEVDWEEGPYLSKDDNVNFSE